ncbi:MAG: hypothetical protein K2K02_00310 [Ruminococcus sp.]|nr:hypothetical protein [Ruminococcus sp.]
MAENFRIHYEYKDYSIPLNYKEGTFNVEEITDFNGKTLDMKCVCDNGIFEYTVPVRDREIRTYYNETARIYDVPVNPVFTATYDSDGVIKHIELHRKDRTDLVYINFHGYEHSKETIYKYSCYLGDWISEKILERTEKIARLFIDYCGDYFSPSILVNAYTPEDVQETIERTMEQFGKPYDDYSAEYYNYPNDSIEPDSETLRIMLMCTDANFCCELYDFVISSITERIKNNVLDKIDKSDDFKLILSDWD